MTSACTYNDFSMGMCKWINCPDKHTPCTRCAYSPLNVLLALLQETGESSYQVEIWQLLSYLLVEYPDFYKYFNETYVPITSNSAYCFCVHAEVNTKWTDCLSKCFIVNSKQSISKTSKIEELTNSYSHYWRFPVIPFSKSCGRMKLENWYTEKVKFQRCSAAQK